MYKGLPECRQRSEVGSANRPTIVTEASPNTLTLGNTHGQTCQDAPNSAHLHPSPTLASAQLPPRMGQSANIGGKGFHTGSKFPERAPLAIPKGAGSFFWGKACHSALWTQNGPFWSEDEPFLATHTNECWAKACHYRHTSRGRTKAHKVGRSKPIWKSHGVPRVAKMYSFHDPNGFIVMYGETHL